MKKKNKEVKQNETIEIIDENEKYRVCIDLKATGNARGGKFVNSNGLKEMIEGIEKEGEDVMVGLVYDGTDRLEILTQNVKENLGKKDGQIDEARVEAIS